MEGKETSNEPVAAVIDSSSQSGVNNAVILNQHPKPEHDIDEEGYQSGDHSRSHLDVWTWNPFDFGVLS